MDLLESVLKKGAIASINSRKVTYKTTNGMPPQCIEAALTKGRVTRILIGIQERISKLKLLNLDSNWINYSALWNRPEYAINHYCRVCDLLKENPSILKDERWTADMSSIFIDAINELNLTHNN